MAVAAYPPRECIPPSVMEIMKSSVPMPMAGEMTAAEGKMAKMLPAREMRSTPSEAMGGTEVPEGRRRCGVMAEVAAKAPPAKVRTCEARRATPEVRTTSKMTATEMTTAEMTATEMTAPAEMTPSEVAAAEMATAPEMAAMGGSHRDRRAAEGKRSNNRYYRLAHRFPPIPVALCEPNVRQLEALHENKFMSDAGLAADGARVERRADPMSQRATLSRSPMTLSQTDAGLEAPRWPIRRYQPSHRCQRQVSRKAREKLSKAGFMMYSKNVRSPVLM